jgi:thioredoxin-related protein
MIKEDIERIREIAAYDKKPMLIYVNSTECYDSKRFSREVMNNDKLKGFLRKNFICMNAAIQTKEGKAMAKKHSVLLMPAIFMYSNDEVLYFPCSMKLDTAIMMNQFRGFVSATKLKEEVVLQMKTGGINQNEALAALAKAYAASYFKKKANSEASALVTAITLNISYFKEFDHEFVVEWGLLKSTGGRREDTVKEKSK